MRAPARRKARTVAAINSRRCWSASPMLLTRRNSRILRGQGRNRRFWRSGQRRQVPQARPLPAQLAKVLERDAGLAPRRVRVGQEAANLRGKPEVVPRLEIGDRVWPEVLSDGGQPGADRR